MPPKVSGITQRRRDAPAKACGPSRASRGPDPAVCSGQGQVWQAAELCRCGRASGPSARDTRAHVRPSPLETQHTNLQSTHGQCSCPRPTEPSTSGTGIGTDTCRCPGCCSCGCGDGSGETAYATTGRRLATSQPPPRRRPSSGYARRRRPCRSGFCRPLLPLPPARRQPHLLPQLLPRRRPQRRPLLRLWRVLWWVHWRRPPSSLLSQRLRSRQRPPRSQLLRRRHRRPRLRRQRRRPRRSQVDPAAS